MAKKNQNEDQKKHKARMELQQIRDYGKVATHK